MKSYLRVRCNKANLVNIREFVRSRLDELQVEGKSRDQIILAVDEACANCMIHSHHCDNYSTLEVAVYTDDDTIYTEIKDPGKAFPMHKYQPKDIKEIAKLKVKGGLGISLIHKIMDEIAIEESKNHCVYRLGKKIPPSGKA